MSELEGKPVSITEDGRSIILPAATPLDLSLDVDQVELRILEAYRRLLFRADDARDTRTISVVRSDVIEIKMTEMPREVLALGVPPFLLEAFLLPNLSSVDSYGLFEFDELELAKGIDFVLEAAREAETTIVLSWH